MTPGQIIALIRDTAVVTALGFLLWLVYRGGEDRIKASDLKDLQKQIQDQAKIEDAWHQEATDANIKLQNTMAAINAAPVVVHDWVRQPACLSESVLPAATGQAGPPRPDAAGVQPKRGGDAQADRRDGIVAEFKARWATELATCQSFLDQWP